LGIWWDEIDSIISGCNVSVEEGNWSVSAVTHDGQVGAQIVFNVTIWFSQIGVVSSSLDEMERRDP